MPGCLALVFCVLAFLPLPFERSIDDAIVHLQFKLRGERDLGDEFVLVYIGAEDIKALGGWPLTHDYYGYATHALHTLGARVIAFNLLFDAIDPRFPEYDEILADFVRSAGNVCLPFAFYDMEPSPAGFYRGHDRVSPFDELNAHAAATGFSNIPSSMFQHRAPVLALAGMDTVMSFGAAMARVYLENGDPTRHPEARSRAFLRKLIRSLPVDEQGQLRLNHFGNIHQLQTVGFVELLQAFEAGEDTLDVSGKIVIIDVTAAGIPTLEATPFSDAMPTSLIHATLAENLIHESHLRVLPRPVITVVIMVLVACLWLACRFQKWQGLCAIAVAALVVLWMSAQMLFVWGNYVMPLLWPGVTVLAATGFFLFGYWRRAQSRDLAVKRLLEREIAKKEAELGHSRDKLAELQAQLQNKAEASAELRRLAGERKQHILELEKKLNDMREYNLPAHRRTPVTFAEIVHAASSPMAEILELITKVASDDIPVLILGETGTGKELIARAIHQSSGRKNAPFVALNCGALPETLLESELFGHEKGSFTGATSRRKGRFELAHRGTIFLDEVTETSSRFQSQLLRVLQESRFERLGGEQTIQVDVRLIAATNQNIKNEVDHGPFRADLFFRLNGFAISLPPLRQRVEDLPLLVRHFLDKHGYRNITGVSERALAALKSYHWPGNVRELENVVRRAAILARSEKRALLQIGDLPPEWRAAESQPAEVDYQPLERQILESLRALKFSHAAISKTAQALGNRDRGTITEYFRGLCFQQLVQNNFDADKSAVALADSRDKQVVAKVKSKIQSYVDNLYPLPEGPEGGNEAEGKKTLPSQFKGLPKKYHPYLEKVIAHLRSQQPAASR